MDMKEQAAGEKRVQVHLIDRLVRLGLVKPSGMTVAQFDVMLEEVRGKLAYMTELNLQALAEHVGNLAGGKNRDRFPIAAKILKWAADIQPPTDDASPLLRAVFAGELGRAAMAEDFGPELLVHVRRSRAWPKGHDMRFIRERAADARRRIAMIEENEGRGRSPSDEDERLRAGRARAAEKCRQIVRLVSEGVQ
ncbi:hypothetical protein JL2886_01026 [Phaeobacter gallaeciensis]|uniref:Uncharacterized protein n=1 Tax=Phaeobacter gallaeciensis TaxID=60890 RepID=A0A1B0ZPA9_9RHOB|nr:MULTISPECIES: hypothetical protein [Phaeobacter]ANP35948.1 hypothetical protein JL2886_01026 [Phaeobacter gallaeciensis]PVZ45154.1 hypothetical protein DD556_17910 [Phaeobacter sp. JL2872]